MSEINLNQRVCENSFTFDNFVVKATNIFAYKASLAVAENQNVIYNPFVIYGTSGAGKTHLALAIKNHINKKYPNKTIEFVKGQINSIDDISDKCGSVDTLIIDDIHLIADTQATQKKLLKIFNERYQKNKIIIVTSDCPIEEIKTLDKRIKSFLSKGLFANIVYPNIKLGE